MNNRRKSKMPCWRRKMKKEPLINKALLPIKAQQFLYTAGTNSIVAYITPHLKLAGLSNGDITVISSVRPIVGIIGPPIVGFCADKIGRYKLVTGTTVFLTAALFSCMLLIPQYGNSANYLQASTSYYEEQNLITIDKCVDSEECNQTLTSFSLYNCHSYNTSSTQEQYPTNTPCILLNESEVTMNAVISEKHASRCVYQIHDVQSDYNTYETAGNMYSKPFHRLCLHQCHVTKSPKCESVIGQWEVTFWPFLLLRLTAQFFMSAAFNAVDTTTMGALKKHGGGYGRHRIWVHLAQGIFPFLAGALMDIAKTGSGGASTMWPAYLLMDVCIFMYIVLLFPVTLHQEKMKGSTLTNLKVLTTDKRCVLLFVQAFFFGLAPGFLVAFLPIFLMDIGSPMYVIGLTRTSTSVASIILMFFSDNLVDRLGYMNVLCAGFIVSAVRMFCYSLIENPMWAILIEMSKAFAQHFIWVALAKWAQLLSPKGLLSTTLGTIRAIAYGIGRTVGVAIGGACLVQIGMRATFQIFAAISLALGIIWLLLHHLVLKRLECLEDPAEPTDQEREIDEIKETQVADEEDTIKASPENGHFTQLNQ